MSLLSLPSTGRFFFLASASFLALSYFLRRFRRSSTKPPALPSDLARRPFGRAFAGLFFFPPGYLPLNHGSYGSIPRYVRSFHSYLQDIVESRPDVWFRLSSFPEERRALERLASALGLPVAACAFTENATAGINNILASIKFQPGDVLLSSSMGYRACQFALQHAALRASAVYEEFPVHFPCSTESLVKTFEDALKRHPRVRFLLLDQITSPTALVLPWQKIASIARSLHPDILIFLDGAHAPGQVSLEEIPSSCVDFFVGNLHKWLFSPRGVALLWVREIHWPLVQPSLTSHEFYSSDWHARFWQQGTRENSRFLAAVGGLEFYEAIGRERLKDANRQMAKKAQDILAEEFGVSAIAPICPESPELEAPFMRNVELPVDFPSSWTLAQRASWCEGLTSRWVSELNIALPTFFCGGRCFVRCSAQVFNEASQYREAARRVLPWLKGELEKIKRESGEKSL